MKRSESANIENWLEEFTRKADMYLEGLEVTDYCGTTQSIGGQAAEEDVLQRLEDEVTIGTKL